MGGCEREKPALPCSSASAPPLLGSQPRTLADSEGRGASDGELAPGTLTLGPAFHAPAAVWPPGLPEQPVGPPLPAILPGTAPNIPRAPLPPSLFMAVSKLQPPLEQLRPLMGTRQ